MARVHREHIRKSVSQQLRDFLLLIRAQARLIFHLPPALFVLAVAELQLTVLVFLGTSGFPSR